MARTRCLMAPSDPERGAPRRPEGARDVVMFDIAEAWPQGTGSISRSRPGRRFDSHLTGAIL